MRSYFVFRRSGCLLPMAIFLNLLFGWLIFKPLDWLAVEGALILWFALSARLAARQMVSQGHHSDSRVIDVEAEVLKEDKPKISKDN